MATTAFTVPDTVDDALPAQRTTNYYNYMRAPFNRPEYYPLRQQLDPALFRPLGAWMGRLVLPSPEARQATMGCLIEIYHAPDEHAGLIGQLVRLRWADSPSNNKRFWGVTRRVQFTDITRQRAERGVVVAERVDGWADVNPFESLAGARPLDDVIVRLHEPVQVAYDELSNTPILYVPHEPSMISGRYYALVRFLGPLEPGGEFYRVAHYNRASQQFDGPESVVHLPTVVPNTDKIDTFTNAGLEHSPCNEAGFYMHGQHDQQGTFVVQALTPRALVWLRPQQVITGTRESLRYLGPRAHTQEAKRSKGQVTSALLCGDGIDPGAALEQWREGDAALLVHVYGAIRGEGGEPYAKSPILWGHFSFGVARVLREPLTDELSFDIEYLQIYVHSGDGIMSGNHHFTHYSGDRQHGWIGIRPWMDVLIKLDSFTDPYPTAQGPRSALDELTETLEEMMARYRIADGNGSSSVAAANNCSQDANQAFYWAIKRIGQRVSNRSAMQAWRERYPEDAQRLTRLDELGRAVRRRVIGRRPRIDWNMNIDALGTSQTENFLRSFWIGRRSWRTMFPSVALRANTQAFLESGAQVWVLRVYQVGGHNPRIEPYVPNV